MRSTILSLKSDVKINFLDLERNVSSRFVTAKRYVGIVLGKNFKFLLSLFFINFLSAGSVYIYIHTYIRTYIQYLCSKFPTEVHFG